MGYAKLIHLIPAISSLLVGIYLVATQKGTPKHKMAGRIWSGLMLFTAITSFAITGGPFAVFHGYSYIHLLSILTLFMVPCGMWAARNRNITLHKFTMISLFVALCVTGILAVSMRSRMLNNLIQ